MDVLVLWTSQSSRPDSFLVERMTSRMGGLFIHRCPEGMRDRDELEEPTMHWGKSEPILCRFAALVDAAAAL